MLAGMPCPCSGFVSKISYVICATVWGLRWCNLALSNKKEMCAWFLFNTSGGFQGMFQKIHRPGRNVVNFPISQVVT